MLKCINEKQCVNQWSAGLNCAASTGVKWSGSGVKAPGWLMYHSTFSNPGLGATGHAAPTPKNPPVTSPCSPVLFSISVVIAVTGFFRALAGLGSAVPRRSRWEKPRSRSGLYHALPLITPWLLGVLRPHRACSLHYPAPGWEMATRPACALRRRPRRQTSPASAPPQLFLGRLTLSSQTKAKKWAFERPTKFGRYEASLELRKKKKNRIESWKQQGTWHLVDFAVSSFHHHKPMWRTLQLSNWSGFFIPLISLFFCVFFCMTYNQKADFSLCVHLDVWLFCWPVANLLLEAWANTSGSCLTSSLVVLRCSLLCFPFYTISSSLFTFFPLCKTLSVEPSSKRTKKKKN